MAVLFLTQCGRCLNSECFRSAKALSKEATKHGCQQQGSMYAPPHILAYRDARGKMPVRDFITQLPWSSMNVVEMFFFVIAHVSLELLLEAHVKSEIEMVRGVFPHESRNGGYKQLVTGDGMFARFRKDSHIKQGHRQGPGLTPQRQKWPTWAESLFDKQ